MATLDNAAASEKAVAAIRYLYLELPIEVRAHDLAHSEKLHQLGATSTVPETVETSLQLGRSTLLDTGVANDQVEDLLKSFRQDGYELLRKNLSEQA